VDSGDSDCWEDDAVPGRRGDGRVTWTQEAVTAEQTAR
jgi:hypothetical protein